MASALLGGEPVEIFRFPGPDAFRQMFPAGAIYGLDVETLYMTDRGQWDPDFRIRSTQFATEKYAAVLDVSKSDERAAAVALLSEPTTRFCSHSDMDVMSVHTRLGVDISDRNIDTLNLAHLAYTDSLNGRDLKTLTTAHIGPELAAWDAKLQQVFKEMWPGKLNAKQSEIDAYGWANVPMDDETYFTYAGLDAIACRRLLSLLAKASGAPKRLLKVETWLASQANRIRIRGMKVDIPYLEALEADTAAGSDPPLKLIKDVSGIPAKSVNMFSWLEQHGADRKTWPGAMTEGGKPSLAKENVKLLAGYDLDEAGRSVVEALITLQQHANMITRTKEIRNRMTADGYLHPVLNTVGTSTHRMSSKGPNFQNFSKKDPRARGILIPELEHILMTADFDQIELRMAAALAREESMIETILAGGDLHQLTADKIGIPRWLAKIVNFLIVYGGGAKALSEQAGISVEEATPIVADYRASMPAISRLSRELGKYRIDLRTISHRRLSVPTDKLGNARSYANINYLIQSSSRDVLVEAWHCFAERHGHREMVWYPVHDELVLQVPEGRVAEVTADIQDSMRFDFMGVPISATAVPLIDYDGRSRWMPADHAEKIAAERIAA